ncbi:MAG: hypothetical protein M1827_002801 [Pycnora praestabilis]|nr:MAG: hypothetical protein M1827_002801 [Pycnora praestabilis]
MGNGSPTRRSQRKRQRIKYSLDAFEGLNILSDISDLAEDPPKHDSEDDEDFAVQDAGEAAATPEEDNLSLDEGSDGGPMNVEESDPEAKRSDGTVDERPKRTPLHRKKVHQSLVEEGQGPAKDPRSIKSKGHNTRTHTRGVSETSKTASKQDHYKALFGTGTEDLVHCVQGRDKWCNDPVLPRRDVDKHGYGGMAHSFFHTQEKRNMEATRGWDWYYDHGGREAFGKRQKVTALSADEGLLYLPRSSKESHSVLMGPNGKQRLYKIDMRKVISIGEAWRPDAQEDVDHDNESKRRPRKGRREGWILNAGAKIKGLGWAPNQHGGTQYLALSTQSLGKAHNMSQQEPSIAPAFAPSQPSPSSMQIWSFAASSKSGLEGHIDTDRIPQLRQVICTEWGELKQFKWCPMPRDIRGEEAQGRVNLGLLAGIWGDGKVRVIDVMCYGERVKPTEYIRLEQVTFEAIPANTICTCVHWLSSSELAVGCANGFVAVWNIGNSMTDEATTSAPEMSPRPWFYTLLHSSYILALVSAYPSQPHLLITSSMDGYMRLTDLRAPATDSILSLRSRVGTDTLAWCDTIQVALSAEENNFIRVYPIRRFYSSIHIAVHPSLVLSLAVGTAHPILLAGGADGSVIATNPIRKIFNIKAQQYQQRWFQHDWTRKGEGTSRISEGFKTETMSLLRNLMGDQKVRDGTVYATIYEEEAGATQVVWNPNIVCGGWAAAGMASGLVRVEDLAL